jgi:hypothetical protein
MTELSNSHLFARRADVTGRSTDELADSKHRKRNQPPPGQPFIWLTKEMLESYGWRAMSSNARLVVDCIAVEHMAHAATMNGALGVSFDRFETFGIRRGTIASAIAEAVTIGFVDLVEKGTRGWGEYRGKTSVFRVAWLPSNQGEPATTRWRRFQSLDEARRAATVARKRVTERHAPRKKLEAVSMPLRAAAE